MRQFMTRFLRPAYAGFFIALIATSALGQSPQLGAGQVFGNSTAAQRPGRAETLTAMFDRAFCATANSALVRISGSWACLASANNSVWATNGSGVPALTSTLPSAVQGNITGTGTLTSGATGTGFTVALGSSTITGALAAVNGGFGSDVSAQSGVPLFAAGVPTFTGTSGAGNFARITGPTITGGSFTTVATFGLLNNGFNTFIAPGGTNTVNRTITINPVDADRTITLGGNINVASGFSTGGSLTLPAILQGDLMYGSASGTMSALNKSATATRYLANTGTSNNPNWDQVNLANGVTSSLPLSNLASISADFLVGNFTAGSAAPGSAAINNCSNALTYSTSTHTFGCNATAGTGTVTSVATAGLATGGTITATGTVSVTAVAKSDQTTGTSNVLAVTPLHQQDHASAAKAWCMWVGATAGTNACTVGYNVTNVTKVGTGTYNVNLTTAFATANYTCSVNASTAGAGFSLGFSDSSVNTSSLVRVAYQNSAGSAADPTNGWIVCYGTQ